MKFENQELRRLMLGARSAYERGDNDMGEWAWLNYTRCGPTVVSTLVACDQRADSDVAEVRRRPDFQKRGCAELPDLIRSAIQPGDRIFEVSAGEVRSSVYQSICRQAD